MDFYFCLFFCISINFFLLADTSKEYQCPERQIKTSGIKIQSPMFPTFPINFRCWYNITAPEDKLVVVKFRVFAFPKRPLFMEANYGLMPQDCTTNYLQLWNDRLGDESTKFCGNELEGLKLTSKMSRMNSSRMNLLFQSYNPYTEKAEAGFEATVTFINQSEYSICDNTTLVEIIEDYPLKWGSQSCILNIMTPRYTIPKIFCLQSSRPHNKGYMNVVIRSRDMEGPSESLTQVSVNTHGIRKRKNNSRFVSIALEPAEGHEICMLDVIFRKKPLSLCGGVFYLEENEDQFNLSVSYPSSDMCKWTIIKENATRILHINVPLELSKPNEDGICHKDHIIASLKLNHIKIGILPMLCGRIRNPYIEIPESNITRHVAVTVLLHKSTF